MASEARVRLPLDVATARRAVDAGVEIAARLLRTTTAADAKCQELVDALRAQHLDLAGAEFDARLPVRQPPRIGAEGGEEGR